LKAQNISGRRIKVEYGFKNIRKRELLEPGQIIEIDDFDYQYLNKLGVFIMGEMVLVEENEIDKMAQAKKDAEQYINQNK
jgi:hypothetical protein